MANSPDKKMTKLLAGFRFKLNQKSLNGNSIAKFEFNEFYALKPSLLANRIIDVTSSGSDDSANVQDLNFLGCQTVSLN